MKMKKLITAGVFVFVFAATANLASAGWDRDRDDRHHRDNDKKSQPTLTVSNENKAEITNKVLTVSNTGLNLSAKKETSSYRTYGHRPTRTDSSSIDTNTAESWADVQTGANDTNINVAAPERGAVNVKNENSAGVNNMVVTVANTGLNKNSSGKITSGYANANSSVVTVVNATVIKIK